MYEDGITSSLTFTTTKLILVSNLLILLRLNEHLVDATKQVRFRLCVSVCVCGQKYLNKKTIIVGNTIINYFQKDVMPEDKTKFRIWLTSSWTPGAKVAHKENGPLPLPYERGAKCLNDLKRKYDLQLLTYNFISGAFTYILYLSCLLLNSFNLDIMLVFQR